MVLLFVGIRFACKLLRFRIATIHVVGDYPAQFSSTCTFCDFLQRERNNVAHTAFTVVAMKEYVDTFSGRDTAATSVVGTSNNWLATYHWSILHVPIVV